MNHKQSVYTITFLILALLSAVTITASAKDVSLTRVSMAWDGSQTDGPSWESVISADARYVAYVANADNVIQNGTKGSNVFLYDQKNVKTELVSVASDGGPADGDSYGPSISSDGRYIAFASEAKNIADNPGTGGRQIYVRDRKTGQTKIISLPLNVSVPEEDAGDPSISGTGRYVAFRSFPGNLISSGGDQMSQIFVRDIVKNTLYLVSKSPSGEKGNDDSGVYGGPSISSDGRFVAFQSYSTNLVKGDTNGASDIFLNDRNTGKTIRISVSSKWNQSNGGSVSPAISGNGRYIAFISDATNLVPGDTNGKTDVFVYDRITKKTERVSVSSSGKQANGDSLSNSTPNNVSLSWDGRFVVFTSQASNLAPGGVSNTCSSMGLSSPGSGTSPCFNIYIRDRKTGKTTRITSAKDGGLANGDSLMPSMSHNGNWLTFVSAADNMIPNDTNGLTDIFVFHQP
jgi:Tol biopolymer transport system component